jgi:hypothetical protein
MTGIIGTPGVFAVDLGDRHAETTGVRACKCASQGL